MAPGQLANLAACEALVATVSVEQYFKMFETGVFCDDARIELINGILMWKDRGAEGEARLRVSPAHCVAVELIYDRLRDVTNFDAYIRSQHPVILSIDSCPHPDGAVVRGTLHDYAEKHPQPADIFAICEVADSSLEFDRTEKLQMYAKSGIEQYIIVNLVEHQIEVFEDAIRLEMRYSRKSIFKPGQKISLRVGQTERFEFSAESFLL